MIKIDLASKGGVISIQNSFMNIVNPKLKTPKGKRLYQASSVNAKLTKAYNTFRKKSHGIAHVYKYMLDHFPAVISDEPKDLVKHISAIKKIYNKYGLTNTKRIRGVGTVGSSILSTLGYEGFSSSKKAYKFVKLLGIDVCPYCNRQWVTTVEATTGRTRATLDHFYSKEEYPYLSMSLFNLVPSCYSCNSSFKGRNKFTLNKNMNPYSDDFENKLHFSIGFVKGQNKIKRIVEFYKDENSLTINLKVDPLASPTDVKRAKRNSEVFHITDLYAYNKDYVVELIQKAVVYDPSYVRSLEKQFSRIFTSKDELNRYVFGNYVNPSDFGKRPLAKLTRDICAELSLPV